MCYRYTIYISSPQLLFTYIYNYLRNNVLSNYHIFGSANVVFEFNNAFKNYQK